SEMAGTSMPSDAIRGSGHDNKRRGAKRERRLGPLDGVAREHLADGVDEITLSDRELRLRLLLQVVVAILAQPGDLRAEDEILDLNLALGLLVAALDDDAGAATFVRVFELRPHFSS